MSEFLTPHEMYGQPFVEQMARSTNGWYHHFKSIELMHVFREAHIENHAPLLVDVGSNVNASLAGMGPRLAFESSWPDGRYVGADLALCAFDATGIAAFSQREIVSLRATDQSAAERWQTHFLPHPQHIIAGHAIVGAAEGLPLQDGTADIVLSSDVLEHILDYRLALRESKRILKPDGRLVLVVPQMYNLNVVQGIQSDVPIIDDKYFTTTHINFWTPDMLANDLAAEGFLTADMQPLGLLMGAAWLIQLDERYAWQQAKTTTSMALMTALADVFLWQQLNLQPNASTTMHAMDHHLYNSPQTLRAIIVAAESPADILALLLELSCSRLGAVAQQFKHILPLLEDIRHDFSPQACERFRQIKQSLMERPFALANDIILTATPSCSSIKNAV